MKRLQNTFKNSKLWTSKDKYIAEVSTWNKNAFPLLEIEIPGFYYDPEKKRYFKITKDYPGKKLVLCHCGGWKDATTTNHNIVIPSNIKVTKVSTIIMCFFILLESMWQVQCLKSLKLKTKIELQMSLVYRQPILSVKITVKCCFAEL